MPEKRRYPRAVPSIHSQTGKPVAPERHARHDPDRGHGTVSALGALAGVQRRLQTSRPEQLDQDITQALAVMGKALDADRGYLFQIRDTVVIQNSHEWAAPGIAPVQPDLKETPFSAGEVYWTAFRRYGILRLRTLSSLAAGSEFHTILTQQKVKSVIAAPIWQHPKEIAGFVGFDFCRATRNFTAEEDALLLCFAASLGSALDLATLTRQRNKLDAALGDATGRLSAMVNALPEFLVEVGQDGLITGFHQGPPLTFALTPAEVIGHPLEQVLPPHIAGISREAMAQVDRNGWSESFSYPLEIGRSEKRYSLQAMRRSAGNDSRPQGYLFVVRDISESYRQDTHLRQLGQVVELSSNLIMLTDSDRRITWMNPTCTRSSGILLEDAVGLRPGDVLRLGQDNSDASTMISAALDRGDPIDLEVRALNQHGLPYWVDLNIQPLRDPEGEIHSFMVVGSDITLHKLAEARALRDRASAMDASQEGIAISRADGSLSYMNAAFRKALGLDEDTQTETLSWHDILPEMLDTFRLAIIPELYAHGQWRGEITLPHSVRQDRHFELSISVQDEGSFLTIARDITAHKDTEKDLALLREQVQVVQSHHLISQVASGLSHDLFNVLAVISATAESLRRNADADVVRGLTHLDAATAQAMALVRNMNRLGQRNVSKRMHNLRELAGQAAGLVRPSLGGDVTLCLELPKDRIDVLCDRTEIMQVLINLLINARNAVMGAGRPRASIGLSLCRADDAHMAATLDIGRLQPDRPYACIIISDTGNGIDAAAREHMFQPYFTTRGENGGGLGLSIVSDILLANKAALSVDTTPGAGSRMTVFWPHAAPDAAPRPPVTTLQGLRVLLVNTNDHALADIAATLTAAGLDVTSCIAPQDAVAAVSAGPVDWDVVLIDHDMTPISGYALAETLLSLSKTLPVVLVDSQKMLQFAKNAAHVNGMKVLSGTVTHAALLAALADVTARKSTSS